MKIVFLDIDGVLNSVRYDSERTAAEGNIDETRLPLLQEILKKTQAKVVLTSSWRKHWNKVPDECDDIGNEIRRRFSRYGISLYDKTPVLPGNDRAEEIRQWLRVQEMPTAFVILDDIPFGWGEDLRDHLVITNARIGRGLEGIHVRKAIDILSCDVCGD